MSRILNNYTIDNSKEIYESLVSSFEMSHGTRRSDIAKAAKEMKAQLKGKDSATKEYVKVLDQIIKDYTKKKTIEELEKEYNDKKFAKYKKR